MSEPEIISVDIQGDDVFVGFSDGTRTIYPKELITLLIDGFIDRSTVQAVAEMDSTP